jgi:hypothetical protein
MPVKISAGSGITEGLELWYVDGRFILVEPKGNKFKDDVTLWNQTIEKEHPTTSFRGSLL